MEKKQHEQLMRRAIALSERAALIEKTGGAFGAVVVKEGKIIGEGYNQVVKHNDPTWHAEMHAIREACKKLKTPHLTGCTLYTSAEPCPMCLGAAYWAQIGQIYHAATVEDAKKYGNFQDIDMFAEFKKEGKDRNINSEQLLQEEALVIWKKFAAMPGHVHY
jgi:guanine deaminase